MKIGAREYAGADSAAILVAIAQTPIHDVRPFLSLFTFAAGSLLGHAGGSLAGKDSSDASATGSNTGDFLFSGFFILDLCLALISDLSVLVSSALAPGMSAAAVDVGRALDRFALRAAIAAALGCQT